MHDDISLRLLYSAVDALVVPSKQEAFGQTAAEAHACATPVVSFNIGGLPDIIENKKSGYLATPFDTKDMAYGIDWVLSQRKTGQLSQTARRLAEIKFSPNTIVEQYLNVYKGVLKQPINGNSIN